MRVNGVVAKGPGPAAQIEQNHGQRDLVADRRPADQGTEVEGQAEHCLRVIGDPFGEGIEHDGDQRHYPEQDAQRPHLQQDQQPQPEQHREEQTRLPHAHSAGSQRPPRRALDLPIQIAVPHVVDDATRPTHDDGADEQQPTDPQHPQKAGAVARAACIDLGDVAGRQSSQQHAPQTGDIEQVGADGPVEPH